MKGITRISNGYLARHYWGKPQPLSEYFYDKEYGSREAAESAAIRWLGRIAEEYPAPVKQKRQPGISYTWQPDKSGNRIPCVEVFWTSYPDEQKHTKKLARSFGQGGSMFQKGDKVEFVNYPNLKGTVREIMPAVDDLPEEISVDVFIPAGEPGFNFTGITENFWCGPESLRANTACSGLACTHPNHVAVNDTIECKDCGEWL